MSCFYYTFTLKIAVLTVYIVHWCEKNSSPFIQLHILKKQRYSFMVIVVPLTTGELWISSRRIIYLYLEKTIDIATGIAVCVPIPWRFTKASERTKKLWFQAFKCQWKALGIVIFSLTFFTKKVSPISLHRAALCNIDG